MSGKNYFSSARGCQSLTIFQQMACAYRAKAAGETTFTELIPLLIN